MAGVSQAQAGLLGFNPIALAAGAALGGIVMAGKSAVEISEQHAKAENNLAQALSTTKYNAKATQDQITAFMQTNRDYISNQADVINSYAQLIRSGLSQTEVQRVMNDALDLSALKSISLTDAVQLLDAAEHGRMKGLIDLGITTAKFTDAQGNLIQSQHNVAQSMAEIDAKVKDGRKSLTPLQTALNDLSYDWEKLALKVGPGLVGDVTFVIKAVDQYGIPVVGGIGVILDQIGHGALSGGKQIAADIQAAHKPDAVGPFVSKEGEKPWWSWMFPLATDVQGPPPYAPGQAGTKTYIDPTTGMQEIVDKQTGKLIEWQTSDQAQRKMAGDKQLEMLDKIKTAVEQSGSVYVTVNVDPAAAATRAAWILRKALQV